MPIEMLLGFTANISMETQIQQNRRYTTIQLDIIHTGDCLEILKGLLQNQVIFAAAPFFFKEGNPGSAEHYIFRLKRSRLMQNAFIG